MKTANHKAAKLSPVPFDRSYWAVPGRVLAGCYPGAPTREEAEHKLAGLLNCGVGLVVNLMESNEVNWQGKSFVDYVPTLQEVARKAGQPIRCERLSIRDNNVPTIVLMRKILDTIDQANAAGEIVYVHCWGGKGRTGTVIGCYLARHGISADEDILARLNELVQHKAALFGRIPQTSAQCDFVKNWKAGQ